MQNQIVKIIIEGTSLANTRNLAQVMRTSPLLSDQSGYRRYTTVISAAWGNHHDFPWSKNLMDFKPSEHDQAVKKYRVWARLIELQPDYNWIIDRFHISAQQYQQENHAHLCEFNWLEEWFQKLGFHLVFLFQNTDEMIRRLHTNGSKPSNNEIEKVIHRQNQLQAIVSRSILPTLELDCSNLGVPETIGKIIDWYECVNVNTMVNVHRSGKIFLPSCS